MRTALKLILIAAALGLVAMGVIWGITARIKTAADVKQETLDSAVPTVAVVHPKLGDLKNEIVLPGNIQAFTDSPIYARTNGYLKKWYVDIGGKVKAGQLLAEIETPEIDKQLDQARADVATAEANLQLSQTTMVRYQELLKTDSVAKQDVDDKIGDYRAKKAMLDSSRANVKRLEDMVSFEKVYAPFDGVVTSRKTDIGALINSGNGGLAQELFHVAATQTLRVYVSVPQSYSRSAVAGVPAQLTLAEFPGRHFAGRLARTAESIDSGSRTLLAEVAVDNASGELLPGAYAEVHLALPTKSRAVILPVNSLLFRSEGLRVAVVREGNTVDLLAISLGKDYGTEVEVVSGITPEELVIVDPPDSLTQGMTVRIARPRAH